MKTYLKLLLIFCTLSYGLLATGCTAVHNRQWAYQIYGKPKTKVHKAALRVDYHARTPRAK